MEWTEILGDAMKGRDVVANIGNGAVRGPIKQIERHEDILAVQCEWLAQNRELVKSTSQVLTGIVLIQPPEDIEGTVYVTCMPRSTIKALRIFPPGDNLDPAEVKDLEIDWQKTLGKRPYHKNLLVWLEEGLRLGANGLEEFTLNCARAVETTIPKHAIPGIVERLKGLQGHKTLSSGVGTEEAVRALERLIYDLRLRLPQEEIVG
ncbi:MAG: hypothetical protein ISS36_02795 [Candidatus Aenigmarchaeota archaeon]|nr:hypothetical protein [Candidatus Aenigmarchaeota archaeon]